jgi:hypothetical protein
MPRLQTCIIIVHQNGFLIANYAAGVEDFDAVIFLQKTGMVRAADKTVFSLNAVRFYYNY